MLPRRGAEMTDQPLAYYNENDPFCAAWLRNLIQNSHIAPGHVDERDIRDVKPYDLAPYTQCHFFAGIGGWSCALRLAGVSDHRPLWTGSCPCQPFSAAGKRLGFADDRHLWPYWRYLIQQRRPAEILGEQVASASQWLGLVRGDLEDLGYAVGAIPIEAASAGADHLRDRYWFVAHDAAQAERRRGVQRPGESNGAAAVGASSQFAGPGDYVNVAHSSSTGLSFRAGNGRIQCEALGACSGEIAADAGTACELADPDFVERWFGNQQPAGQFAEQQRDQEARDSDYEWVLGADGKARRVKPGVRLLVDGFPNRVGLLRGFGNAIDPRPAAEFIRAALT
jgi:DNA (cytosine-5)-methyltransferase 1